MSFLFKVSKPGYDVLTCGNENLVLNSDLDTLKTSSVGTTSSSVAHGLAYVPCYFAIVETSVAGRYCLVGGNYDFSTNNPSIDSTYFYPGDGTAKYYIFYQENV